MGVAVPDVARRVRHGALACGSSRGSELCHAAGGVNWSLMSLPSLRHANAHFVTPQLLIGGDLSFDE